MPIPALIGAALMAAATPLAELAGSEIAKLLGGDDPASQKTGAQVAQSLVSVAAQVSGIPIANEHDARNAAQAIELDPAKLAEFRRIAGEQVITLIRLDNEDRANARHREIELKDPTPSRLAFMILGGFMAYTFTIMVSAVLGVSGMKDPLIAGLIGTGYGALGSEAARIGNYYFGSSAGSAAKDKLLRGR